MQERDLDLPTRVVYHSYRFLRTFRATAIGSEAGPEFERRFREWLYSHLNFDLISSTRDLGLGQGLVSRSGLVHELDLIARNGSDYFVFETKHYAAGTITKDMVLVFHQKVLDFYLENYSLLEQYRIHRLFVTQSAQVDPAIRQFCAAWGILLIDRQLYPSPICEVILESLTHETRCSWLDLERLEHLRELAADLTARLWRGLDDILSLQPGFPGGLYLDLQKVPPSRETGEWVAEHRSLANEVRALKTRLDETLTGRGV